MAGFPRVEGFIPAGLELDHAWGALDIQAVLLLGKLNEPP